jgi:mono/diheme cytochrome c family protein
MLKRLIMLCCILSPVAATAQDRSFTLNAPEPLVTSGFMKHLLPRFSLKTGVRISVTDGEADAGLGPAGTPVFRKGDTVWHLTRADSPHTEAFEAWLLSDVGKRTIEAFAPDGEPEFSADVTVVKAVSAELLDGDSKLGEKVSLKQCGRCHVVNESNRMNAIGSTPSFALMRSLSDWQSRFETFFALRPHPAFTQVKDVTEPFPENLPSPIAPIEVTLEDIEAIMAYVDTIVPADLGAPIQSQ